MASTVGILLGNGDGTFKAAKSLRLAAGEVGQVAIADLNNDGKPDLVATAGTSIVVFMGRGDGTFKAAVSFPIGLQGAYSGRLPFALADMNGDGKLDAVVSGDDYVQVLIGNGLGQFGAPTSYYSGSSGANVSSVAVADLNGDGKPDVAVANFPYSSVGVFLNSGNGTLLPVVTHDIAESIVWDVAISDLNGYLKPDLVVAATGATASALLGNGDGTFQAPTTFPSGGFAAEAITVADLNGDRRPDLVFSDGGSFADILLHTPAIPLIATTVALKSSQNPSVLGQPVTLSAVAAGSGHPPDGELMTFMAGTQILGIAPLHVGVASLTVTSLSVGHHSLTAHYPGDSDFLRPSTSPSINQLVEPQ